jgi:hypothetical protein
MQSILVILFISPCTRAHSRFFFKQPIEVTSVGVPQVLNDLRDALIGLCHTPYGFPHGDLLSQFAQRQTALPLDDTVQMIRMIV